MMKNDTTQVKIKLDTMQINKLYKDMELLANSGVKNNFNRTNVNFPKNPYTNEIYQANHLYEKGHLKGFNETRWLTEAEINSNGLQLKPDEVTNFFESDLYQHDEYYNKVKFYNVEQLDKASFDILPTDEKPTPSWAKNEIAEKFIQVQDPTILHNSCSNPRYSQATHIIYMPHPSQYDTAEDYYNDLFHEIGHSTAKELKRISSDPKKWDLFARKDELVAELTAMKLCESLKVESDKDKNLAYLKKYLSQFGDNMLDRKKELGIALIQTDSVLKSTKKKYNLVALMEGIKADKSVEEMVSNYIDKLEKAAENSPTNIGKDNDNNLAYLDQFLNQLSDGGKGQRELGKTLIGTDKPVEEWLNNYLKWLEKSTEKSRTNQVEKVTPAPKESCMEL